MIQGLDRYSHLNPLAIIPKHCGRNQVSEYWTEAQTLPDTLSPADQQVMEQIITGELARLQLAYPSQTRNYSQEEVAATCALWTDMFGRIHPQLFHEAVDRFILNDRKGFFPAPGQVVKYVEDIIMEVREVEYARESFECLMRMDQIF